MVVRTALGQSINGRPVPVLGGYFLQPRLEVVGSRTARSGVDAIGEHAQNEATGRFDPAVQIRGTDHSFDCVGEDRTLLAATRCVFTLSESKVGADPKVGPGGCERIRRYDCRASLGQLALR